MAKRFTDTEKWKRPWFRKLSCSAKLVWFYLLDQCDHSGIWHADFELLSFQLGEEVTSKELEAWFGEKLTMIESDKYFIPSFVDFQYGELNPNNNAHKSVIATLEKVGANNPLNSPFLGAQDKDKDKDKDQDKNKERENFDFDLIYKKYPRKIGKQKGITSLKTKIKNQEEYEALGRAVSNYARYCEANSIEAKFIKHFSSFVSVWQDWIEYPEESPSFGTIPQGVTDV